MDEGQVLKDQTPGQTGQGESETGICGLYWVSLYEGGVRSGRGRTNRECREAPPQPELLCTL